jgi:hypothetical protein
MANDFTAIGSAVYSRLGSVGTVSVYQDLAPQGAAVPYCVFQRQTATDDYVFGPGQGTAAIVEAIYTVRVVSNRYNAAEAQIVYGGNTHPAMQDAPLSVTGYTVLRCRRESIIQYQDNDKYWHVGGLYRLEVQPT